MRAAIWRAKRSSPLRRDDLGERRLGVLVHDGRGGELLALRPCACRAARRPSTRTRARGRSSCGLLTPRSNRIPMMFPSLVVATRRRSSATSSKPPCTTRARSPNGARRARAAATASRVTVDAEERARPAGPRGEGGRAHPSDRRVDDESRPVPGRGARAPPGPSPVGAGSCPPPRVPRRVRHALPGLLRAPRTNKCRSVVSPNRLGGSGRSRGFTAPTGGLAAGQVELSALQLVPRSPLVRSTRSRSRAGTPRPTRRSGRRPCARASARRPRSRCG